MVKNKKTVGGVLEQKWVSYSDSAGFIMHKNFQELFYANFHGGQCN